MLASVLSLTTISIVRFLGIRFSNRGEFRLSFAVVCVLIALIWVIALVAAIPTIIFRRYWVRDAWKIAWNLKVPRSNYVECFHRQDSGQTSLRRIVMIKASHRTWLGSIGWFCWGFWYGFQPLLWLSATFSSSNNSTPAKIDFPTCQVSR